MSTPITWTTVRPLRNMSISTWRQSGGKTPRSSTSNIAAKLKYAPPVIMALWANGIEVTAVHSHMLDERPRLFFLHFSANDDALKLAKGLRAALDKTASTKSESC
jgi:hypothetical protein